MSLYVHIPWCVRKCPYCDFNSHAADKELPEAQYVECLRADLKEDAKHRRGRLLQSIFFGGGTPSLFSATSIGKILEAADDIIGIDQNCEITLEANPGTAEQKRFRDYRAVGINRLSIGIQSLNGEHLQALGRIHDPSEAVAAYRMARDVGYDNINLDLMHGLPGQSLAQALADLDGVIALAPDHISWYQLTLEPNTAFYNQPPVLPDDDSLAQIEEEGFTRLAASGFERYEISAFSQPERQARHNVNYWQFGDYLGIGAGAHGKVTDPERGAILRRQHTRLPSHYLGRREHAAPQTDWNAVDPSALPLEFMMNALRLLDGTPASFYRERSGLPLEQIAETLAALRGRGLLVNDPEKLATTALGRRFLNDVLDAFMVDDQH